MNFAAILGIDGLLPLEQLAEPTDPLWLSPESVATFVIMVVVTAMALSMVIVPAMIRLAPALRMVDQPDPRKVHAQPVARVGGIGIVLGALVAFLMWGPLTPLTQAYLFGAVVLFTFGALDDALELGHYPKFVGQFIAVIPVIWYGGLYVSRFPFFETLDVPVWLCQVFTLVAVVGVINAVNHSDGLDGLAAGEVMLSLIVVGFFGFLARSLVLIVVVASVVGGVLGFLRYNTHPARVFMGDSGSQFLGFSVAFAVVYLTQNANTAMSPAAALLLLGLPVIDILAVFYLRWKGGMNLFKATRNHIHHRLLDLGFSHPESVVVNYAVQAAFVFSAVLLAYERDWLLLGVYLGAVLAIFSLITLAERSSWRAHDPDRPRHPHRLLGMQPDDWQQGVTRAAVSVLLILVPGYLLVVPVLVTDIPQDFALLSGILAAVMLAEQLFARHNNSVAVRAILYVATLVMVYLWSQYAPAAVRASTALSLIFFGLLVVSVGTAIRFGKRNPFRVTPTDYLSVFLLLAVALFQSFSFVGQEFSLLVIKFLVVLYCVEYLSFRGPAVRTMLHLAASCGLLVLCARALWF